MNFVAGRTLKLAVLTEYWSQLQTDGWIEDLVKAPFTPTLQLTAGDVVLANFTGYVAAEGAPDPFTLFQDQVTSNVVLAPNMDVGTNPSVAKAGAGVTPQTMFGWILKNNVGGVLLASSVFVTPVPIIQEGDGVVFPTAPLNFSPGFMV